MSALGQKRTLRRVCVMSALCQKQTFRAAKGMPLFDHLVGAEEQGGWYGKAKRLGGFEVD
jgi:hypothetical protein